MTCTARRVSLFVFLLLGLLALPAAVHADPKAIAEARKQESEAKVAVAKAQKSLETAKEAVKVKNPEYAAAQKDANKAKVEHDAATKAAAEKARATPEYAAAKKAFEEADANAKTVQSEIRAAGTSAGKPLTDQLSAATATRAEAKAAMERLENEAIAADEKVQAAKAALTAAQAKLEEQGKKLEEVAATDKACEDAKKELEDAQKKLEEAKTAVAEAIKKNKEESQGKRGKGGGGVRGFLILYLA